MKQIRRCLRCGDVFPESVCYQVEADMISPSAITGKVEPQTVGGYICAGCNMDMGFKTNAEKFVRAATQKGISPQDIEVKLNKKRYEKETEDRN